MSRLLFLYVLLLLLLNYKTSIMGKAWHDAEMINEKNNEQLFILSAEKKQ